MKINKKLKHTFISSLTLIASTISVVACGNKNHFDDKNYNNFLTSLNNNLKGSDKQNEFFQKKSSFSKIYSHIKQLPDFAKNAKFSILGDINPEKTYVFDSKNKIKLSDLKYNGIKVKNNNIIFTNDEKEKKIWLKDAFFVSNFDISVSYKDAVSIKKSVTYNLSSFFQLENKKDFIDLNFKDFDSSLKMNGTSPIADFKLLDNVKLNLGNEKKDQYFEIGKNSTALGIAESGFPLSIRWDDANFFDVNEDFHYYNVAFDKDILFNTKEGIFFTYNSLLVNGYLWGSSSDDSNYYSDFFLIADLTKLDKDNNFSFSVTDTNPLIIIFYKKLQ